MDSSAECAPRPWRWEDQTQWRDEVMRPLVLCADRPAAQRAQAPATHPETVRTRPRRFASRGGGGLPGAIEVVRRGRAGTVPAEVREELARLNALSNGLHYRALARLGFCTCASPLDAKTAPLLWPPSPVPTPPPLELWPSPTHPERDPARRPVGHLYDQGWDKLRIRRFVPVARPAVATWIARCEAEHGAGLLDKKRGPQAPPRQGWLPRMGQGSHRQKAHPDAGALRIRRLRAQPDIAGRTVGRMMALTTRVDEDIPRVLHAGPQAAPQPQPSQAP